MAGANCNMGLKVRGPHRIGISLLRSRILCNIIGIILFEPIICVLWRHIPQKSAMIHPFIYFHHQILRKLTNAILHTFTSFILSNYLHPSVPSLLPLKACINTPYLFCLHVSLNSFTPGSHQTQALQPRNTPTPLTPTPSPKKNPKKTK